MNSPAQLLLPPADSIRAFVDGLPPEKLEPGARVSEPVNPVLAHASTHGTRNFEDFVALKELERRGTLGLENVEYGRYGNLAVQKCEDTLAKLDQAETCVLCNSGMSAINTVLYERLIARPPLVPDQKHHIIVGVEGYRKTREILGDFERSGLVEVSVIPMTEFANIGKYVKPNTSMVFFETPSNPFLRVIDVAAVTEQTKAKNKDAIIVVDHTFASPVNQQPLKQGADIVVPSLTKYIGGHNDLIAGAILGSRELVEPIRKKRGAVGSIASEDLADRVLRGLLTLELRVEALNRNGLHVAELLDRHPQTNGKVWYPGLSSHPDHETAKRQMSGFGGVVTFSLGSDLQGVARFVNAMRAELNDAWIAPSFGGPQAFIAPVAVVSHFQETPEQRAKQRITDDLIRLSVGVYKPELLTGALCRGFAALG